MAGVRGFAGVFEYVFKFNKFYNYDIVDGGIWLQSYFEGLSENLLNNVGYAELGLNAGQQVIWDDYMKPSFEDYVRTSGSDYTAEGCLSYVESDIGSEKFNALSILANFIANEIAFIWDNSYAGDGWQDKWFVGLDLQGLR